MDSKLSVMKLNGKSRERFVVNSSPAMKKAAIEIYGTAELTLTTNAYLGFEISMTVVQILLIERQNLDLD